MDSFRANLAEQKEVMSKKRQKLMSDLEVLTRDKQQMKQNLLKKSLLLINEKKQKIRELCEIIEQQKQENEALKKDLLEAQTKKPTKRSRKRVKQK